MFHPYEEGFPNGTAFALYAGLPLTRIGDECRAWDRPGGRLFDRKLFAEFSSPCDEATFRHGVEQHEFLDYRRSAREGIEINLPERFPEGTTFADYEGVPLAGDEQSATAWDVPGGRWFNSATFEMRSYAMYEQEFRLMIDKINRKVIEKKNKKHKSGHAEPPRCFTDS